MIKQYKTVVTLLLLLTLPGLTSAQTSHQGELIRQDPRAEILLFEAALSITEAILSQVTYNQSISSENLDAASYCGQQLLKATFHLLPKDLQVAAFDLLRGENGIDPQTLSCSNTISAYQYHYIYAQFAKLVITTALLHVEQIWPALGVALIPPEYLSLSSSKKLHDCQALWEEKGLTTSDAQAIDAKKHALAQTAFFSAAVLKMKYEDLAQLPWNQSSTWGPKEWKQVDEAFFKIKILLANLHGHLLGDPTESIYTSRLNAIER